MHDTTALTVTNTHSHTDTQKHSHTTVLVHANSRCYKLALDISGSSLSRLFHGISSHRFVSPQPLAAYFATKLLKSPGGKN